MGLRASDRPIGILALNGVPTLASDFKAWHSFPATGKL
jgi:hypothetical protein